MKTQDIQKLKEWFLNEQRQFPWRETTDPYAIWVSEVMLQQTQASVVVPYFNRWMKQFPTIKALSESSQDVVLKAWEGLGYYSRARLLHSGAQYLMTHHNGQLPKTKELLSKIKGLGPYTIGAILSFAFHERECAVDGNVLRVIARYDAIPQDITALKTIKCIRDRVQELLPIEESWIISEALIELGATICMKKPKCSLCPLKSGCQAYIKGMADQLPIKAKKSPSIKLIRAVAVLIHDNHILMAKGSIGNVMEGLYEFPYIELESPALELESLINAIENNFGVNIKWNQALPAVRHSFTKFRALLYPHVFDVLKEIKPLSGSFSHYEWHPLSTAKKLTLSSGHKKILYALLNLYK